MTYSLSDISEIEILNKTVNRELFDTTGTVGIGAGLNYGFHGLCIEYNLPLKYSSIFGGIGYSITSDIGWGIGMRYYFDDFYSAFQPRISIQYGTNYILSIENKNDDNNSATKYEVGRGINLGGGFKWMFGDTNTWGLDFDLYYIIHSTIFSRIEELEEEGYRFANDENRTIRISVGVIFSY